MPELGTREISVAFATNRKPGTSKANVVTFAGAWADKLSFGTADLLAGREQVVKRAERRASGSGLLENSASDLTSERLIAVRNMATSEGLPAATSSPMDAFVFVHGYNVSFEDALKRTAQIAFDLDFAGPSLLFSWPSEAKLFGYGYDRDSADIAVNHFIAFLDAASSQMPGTKIHIIAHSMGNVVVLAALEKIALRGSWTPRPLIGEIVLAHPDVDQDRFRQLAGTVKGVGAGMTLYTSQSDVALWASKLLRGVGRAGGTETVVSGVDTVDITGLGTSFWSTNHSVFSANPIVFGDIARLMSSSVRPPSKRSEAFEEVKNGDAVHWRYRQPVASGALEVTGAAK